jgi:aminopeptidase N
MLRQRIGDPAFFRMLTELRRRFELREFTNQDLRTLAVEFMPASTAVGGPSASESMGVFFDNWISSTGIPELRLRYTTETVASGKSTVVRLTGSIEQKNVGDDFSVDVPVEIQLPGGRRQTLWVRTNDAGGRFSATLPQQPSRVSIPSSGVLATIK